MKPSEIYAICIGVFILGLAWLAAGVPGMLCGVACAIAGNIDVSWIDDLERRPPQPMPISEPQPLDVKEWKRIEAGMKPKELRKAQTAQLIEFPRRDVG